MNKLAKSAVFVAVLMVVAKILGLLKEVLLAHQFGTSYIVDAYTIACSLPTVMFTMFASGFSNSYLPVYMRVDGKDKRNDFFRNVITILTVISIAFSLICIIFSRQLTFVMAPGFDEKSAELTSIFIKILAIYLPFFTAFNILTAHLSANENFVASQFCDTIIVNIIISVAIVLASPENPYILVIGYVLAMVTATVTLFIYMTRRKYIRFAPRLKLNDADFKMLVSLAIPLGISMLVGQLNAVVDRIFSTSLGSGVTSALGYAHRVEVLPYSFIATIFLTLCKPRMNACFAKGDNEGGMVYAKRAFLVAIYAAIPIVFGFILFASPIIRLIFERGAFDSESTKLTASCLIFYAIGMPFYATRDVTTAVLGAKYKQKLILVNTIVAVVSNIVLNFVLVGVLEHRGLALATSLSGLCSCAVMLVFLKKMKLKLFDKTQISDISKILLCTVVSILPVWYMFQHLKNFVDDRLLVIFCALIAIVVYLFLGVLVNIKILKWVYGYMPSRFKIIKKWNVVQSVAESE